MSLAEDDVEIDDVVCTFHTAKAIKVEGADFDGPCWVPQSVISDDSEVYKKGTEGRLAVKRWFAKKVGWVED